jgi:hypothetical protein
MPEKPQHSIFDNMPLPEPVWKRTTILGTLFLSQAIYILFIITAVSSATADRGLDLKHGLYLLLAAVHIVAWIVALIKRKAFGFIIAAMQYTAGVIIIASSFFTTWNRSGVLIPSIILLAVSLSDLVMLSMPSALNWYRLKQPAKLATKYALAVVLAMASVGLLLGINYL